MEPVTIRSTAHPLLSDDRDTIKVISLNLAHGRGQALNQLLVSEKKIRENLEDIAEFFIDEKADVIALQEVDAPSFWSGKFDHVEFLAENARYPMFAHTPHARIKIGNYGTAVISRLPIISAIGVTFKPTPPTASKGFTLAELEWKEKSATKRVDIISVHLDFSREKVRQQQIATVSEVLSRRDNPVIVTGDLNSENIAQFLLGDDNKHGLHSVDDESGAFNTYKNKRLDWILLSEELRFEGYRVSPVLLSDHLAVLAEVGFTTEGEDD